MSDLVYSEAEMLTSLLQMVREEGPSSLLRGVGPNVFRSILMNSSQLAS